MTIDKASLKQLKFVVFDKGCLTNAKLNKHASDRRGLDQI